MEENAAQVKEVADFHKHLMHSVNDKKAHFDDTVNKILLAFNYNSYKMHDENLEKEQKKPKGVDESIAVYRALEEAGIIKQPEKTQVKEK